MRRSPRASGEGRLRTSFSTSLRTSSPYSASRCSVQNGSVSLKISSTSCWSDAGIRRERPVDRVLISPLPNAGDIGSGTPTGGSRAGRASSSALSGGKASKCGLLLGVRHAPGGGEVARPLVVGEVGDGAVDLTGEVVACRAVSEAPEIGWERGAPVDADLPRACLVGKEDDAVGILVDAAQESEEQLERFTNGSMRGLHCNADALLDDPVELGDERLRPLGLVHEVLRVDAEALVVLAAQARVVELPDFIEERCGAALALRELVQANHVANERAELRPRHDLDRPLGDHQEIAPAH